jgi:hypothetical protein
MSEESKVGFMQAVDDKGNPAIPAPSFTVTHTDGAGGVWHQLQDAAEGDDGTYEGPDHPGVLDIIIQKIVSRKLLVWVIATFLLVFHVITQDVWLTIAGVYLGSAALIEIVEKLKAPVAAAKPGEGEA